MKRQEGSNVSWILLIWEEVLKNLGGCDAQKWNAFYQIIYTKWNILYNIIGNINIITVSTRDVQSVPEFHKI